MHQKKKFCVKGTSFIGLPAACFFAIHDFEGMDVDIDGGKWQNFLKDSVGTKFQIKYSIP